jgi:polyhydroxybutyrate depolymerase
MRSRRRATRATRIVISAALLFTVASCSDDDAPRTQPATTRAPDCTPARTASPGITRDSFRSGGASHEYELSLPPGYDGTIAAPILLSIHGFTSNIGQQDAATRYPAEAGKRGYIVVTPQANEAKVPLQAEDVTAPFWNVVPAFTPPAGNTETLEADDDIGWLLALLDHLEETLCVDAEREYVSGISNGASMTVVLICNEDQRFAAAAPVAGVNLATICTPKRATPTIAFHGDADRLVSYTGGEIFGFDLGLPSVRKRMTDFAVLGDCDAKPEVTKPYDDIRHFVWKCPPGMGMELYTVLGGGHTWPGTPPPPTQGTTTATPTTQRNTNGKTTLSIDATNLALDFFDAHTLANRPAAGATRGG